MIGLEYIMQITGTQHQELSDKLGIKKKNINLWIKKKQHISQKYLPMLSQIFCINAFYFQKEITDSDKIAILTNEIEKLKGNEKVLKICFGV